MSCKVLPRSENIKFVNSIITMVQMSQNCVCINENKTVVLWKQTFLLKDRTRLNLSKLTDVYNNTEAYAS